MRLLFGLTSLLLIGSARGEETSTIPAGYKNLFNGTNLNGWKVHAGNMAVWGVDKGVIYCDKGGGGWLLTEEEYGDFDLWAQFRWSKEGGNSGVGLRAPRTGDPAYQGMEIQLIDDENWAKVHKFELKPTQHTASVYDVQAPLKPATNKPIGEWNSIHITCKGTQVTIEVNGVKVNDIDLAKFKDSKGKSHPGILRDKGCIGFQSYNIRVEFKNIWIKTL